MLFENIICLKFLEVNLKKFRKGSDLINRF